MEKRFRILHFAYVYKDIEKQMNFLKSLNDNLKFNFREIKDGPIKYKGKDSIISLRVALTELFGVNLEIIQWIKGECPHKDFLDEGKEGLHHIAVLVDDVQLHIKEYQQQGADILLSGQMGEFDIAYMDTVKQLGVIIELFGPHKR